MTNKILEKLNALFEDLVNALKEDEEEENKKSELSGFVFTELSSEMETTQTYIDGMAAGTFTTAYGEEITFLPEELEDYVANTKTVIESTRTERGEIVGLPIDEDGHDHKGGAGWIVGVELDKPRNVIRFLVNWTEKGVALVKSNARRYFSPSIDKGSSHIRGGSMTNWPATRLPTGQFLLRPVELSEQLKELDMPKSVMEAIDDLKNMVVDALKKTPEEDTREKETTVREKVKEIDLENTVSPALAELLGSQEGIEELGKRAVAIAQDAITAEKRKIHTVEFAARVVGGTRDKPFGLAIKPNDLVALLLSLPERQARAVESILEKTLNAAVDFSEHGVDSLGYLRKPKLPNEYAGAVRQWVGSKKTLKEFFAANPEVGKFEDFDLAEFAETAKE